MEPEGREKYQDPADPCKVYGKSLTTTSSSVTPFKFSNNMKLLICSSACVPSSGLNLGSHFSGASGNACQVPDMLTAPGLVHGSASMTLVVDDTTVEIPDV